MHVYGPTHLNGAQPIGPPHASRFSAGQKVAHPPIADEVRISDAARLAEQTGGAADIRYDRVAEIRAQIAAGTYETPEKLDIAISRLLDEIG